MKTTILTTALAVGVLFATANTYSQASSVDNSEENGYFQHDCENESGDYLKINHHPTRAPQGQADVFFKVNGLKYKLLANFTSKGGYQLNKTIYEFEESSTEFVTLFVTTQIKDAGNCQQYSRVPCGVSDFTNTVVKALLNVNGYEVALQCK